jgi:hypothetical protein
MLALVEIPSGEVETYNSEGNAKERPDTPDNWCPLCGHSILLIGPFSADGTACYFFAKVFLPQAVEPRQRASHRHTRHTPEYQVFLVIAWLYKALSPERREALLVVEVRHQQPICGAEKEEQGRSQRQANNSQV